MDYQAIIDNLTPNRVKEILTKLGIEYDEFPNHLQMRTVCHNHKDEECSKKLYYYFNNKVFYCYTNCLGMSIFKFLKNYYEAQDIEYDWYTDIYQVITEGAAPEGFSRPKYVSLQDTFGKQKKDIELPEYNSGVMGCFINYYTPEWLNDGITKQTMDKYNIKFSISQNKIIIPHLDPKGRLVGIRGRALSKDEIEAVGKYMPIQIENTWYKHPLSMNLYGLYQNKENIKRNHICFLFEAEKSVLQMDSFGMDNCAVAVCGSQFNKYQLNMLVKECAPSEIVICFDNEEEPDSHKYFDKLYNICTKYKNYCNFSFIYDRENLTNKKDSPTDCGEEIFNKLLSRRVRVK